MFFRKWTPKSGKKYLNTPSALRFHFSLHSVTNEKQKLKQNERDVQPLAAARSFAVRLQLVVQCFISFVLAFLREFSGFFSEGLRLTCTLKHSTVPKGCGHGPHGRRNGIHPSIRDVFFFYRAASKSTQDGGFNELLTQSRQPARYLKPNRRKKSQKKSTKRRKSIPGLRNTVDPQAVVIKSIMTGENTPTKATLRPVKNGKPFTTS